MEEARVLLCYLCYSSSGLSSWYFTSKLHWRNAPSFRWLGQDRMFKQTHPESNPSNPFSRQMQLDHLCSWSARKDWPQFRGTWQILTIFHDQFSLHPPYSTTILIAFRPVSRSQCVRIHWHLELPATCPCKCTSKDRGSWYRDRSQLTSFVTMGIHGNCNLTNAEHDENHRCIMKNPRILGVHVFKH